MSYPNYPKKYQPASLLQAEGIVAYRKRLGRLPAIEPVKGVLFCLERGLPKRMGWHIPVRKAGSMNADLYRTKKKNTDVTILTNFGGGAPIVVELAEELAVMGAKKMILMTWAGTLQPGLKAGDIVVCDRAIRDDGVSQHYLPDAKYVNGDAALVEQLAGAIRARGVPCTIGDTWTTAAPYRETLEEVRQYQAEGVKVVEMESAGLFTIGQVRHIQTAAVVVVMDSLGSLQWKVPEKLDGIMQALDLVYAAAIDTLSMP